MIWEKLQISHWSKVICTKMKRHGVDEFFGLMGYYGACAGSCLPKCQSMTTSIHCLTTQKYVDPIYIAVEASSHMKRCVLQTSFSWIYQMLLLVCAVCNRMQLALLIVPIEWPLPSFTFCYRTIQFSKYIKTLILCFCGDHQKNCLKFGKVWNLENIVCMAV
jgi:hypothetical protein